MNSENEEPAGRGHSAAAKCFKVPFFIINIITWVSKWIISFHIMLAETNCVTSPMYT